MKIDKDINNNDLKKYGDVDMPNGKLRNIVLLVVGTVAFMIIVPLIVYGVDTARNWLSEHGIHLIEIVGGMTLVFIGGYLAMHYRRFDKEVLSIIIIVVGAFIIAYGLFGLGLMKP